MDALQAREADFRTSYGFQAWCSEISEQVRQIVEMDTGHSYQPPQSPSQLPASHVKYHHPYFSPTEVELLSEKQRGKLAANQEKLRQQACGFIEAVCRISHNVEKIREH